MSCFVNQITQEEVGHNNVVTVDIALKKRIGLSGHCFIAEDDEDEIDGDTRVVRVNLELPPSFFKPLNVNISANKELTKALEGSLQSITVPVVVDGTVGEMIVESTIEDTKVTGGVLLSMLRRAVKFLEDDKGNK
jgi:hypothetical protein